MGAKQNKIFRCNKTLTAMYWVSNKTVKKIPMVRKEQIKDMIDSIHMSRSRNGNTYYRLSDVERAVYQYTDNEESIIEFLRDNAVKMGNSNGNETNPFPGGCNGRSDRNGRDEYSKYKGQVHIIMDTNDFLKMVHHN